MKVFQALDRNHDGQLDKDELRIGFQKTMNDVDAEAEVDRIFDEVDVDGNGCIDFSEFVTVTVDKKKLLTKQRLKTAFGLFDNDGDGSIDINEFKKIF